jgi:small GTP-binding protein
MIRSAHDSHVAIEEDYAMPDKSKSGRSQRGNLLSVGTLLKLPATIGTMRAFMDALNWNAAEQDVRGELRHRIVIAGRPNTGKSTLFNAIRGRYQSAVAATPGTTQGLVRGEFGPFMLIDTPGHLPEQQEDAARAAAVVVLLIDGVKGLTKEDRDLYDRLRALGRPIVVAINKCDALRSDPEAVAEGVAGILGADDAIPISARLYTNIAEDLIPAMIEASPDAALAIGRQMPAFRRAAAERIIRNAALITLAAGLEPVPLVDIPIILGSQVRLVLRIAALYGEPVGSQHLRELGAAVAGGLFMRYLAEEASKAVPFGGDLVSGVIAASGTWAIGWVALEYFESGKHLSTSQMRQMFDRLYARFRAEVRSGVTPAQLPAPSAAVE